jgi:hypothetical protein
MDRPGGNRHQSYFGPKLVRFRFRRRVSGAIGRAAAQLNFASSALESKIHALKINKFRFKRD